MEKSTIENEKPQKKSQRLRELRIGIHVTQEERNMLERRMEQAGIKSMRAFLLKMGIDGRVIHVEIESVQEMVRLLLNATNNINQIAKVANETGNIYARDVAVLQGHIEEIWGQTRIILQKISRLQ